MSFHSYEQKCLSFSVDSVKIRTEGDSRVSFKMFESHMKYCTLVNAHPGRKGTSIFRCGSILTPSNNKDIGVNDRVTDLVSSKSFLQPTYLIFPGNYEPLSLTRVPNTLGQWTSRWTRLPVIPPPLNSPL